MTNKDNQENLYSKELYNDEMEMINSELKNLDDLYDEIKTHFDGVKNSQSRGSLTFLKDQTSNLISIKTTKLNYIKQRADMKKSITDFAFKEKQTNKQETEIDSITAEIVKKISNEFKYVPDEKEERSEEIVDIENALDEALSDENIDTIVENSTSIENISVDYSKENEEDTASLEEHEIETDENIDEESEEDNTVKAIDIDTGLFYLLDKDSLDVVEELGFIEDTPEQVTIDEDVYAIGESGTLYLAISLDSEDDE